MLLTQFLITSFKNEKADELFEAILNEGIELVDFEQDDDYITISANPADVHKVKDIIESILPNVDYEIDEIGYYAKDKVTLNEEDQQLFDRLYNLLDEIEDVTEIYHNVKMD